jgi:hypothetical protein
MSINKIRDPINPKTAPLPLPINQPSKVINIRRMNPNRSHGRYESG